MYSTNLSDPLRDALLIGGLHVYGDTDDEDVSICILHGTIDV